MSYPPPVATPLQTPQTFLLVWLGVILINGVVLWIWYRLWSRKAQPVRRPRIFHRAALDTRSHAQIDLTLKPGERVRLTVEAQPLSGITVPLSTPATTPPSLAPGDNALPPAAPSDGQAAPVAAEPAPSLRSPASRLESFPKPDLRFSIGSAARTLVTTVTGWRANAHTIAWRSFWLTALELGLITLVVLSFCTPFLKLNSDYRLPGNEADVFQLLDWTVYNSLRDFGQFPQWNPYLRTGIPFVSDPMLHVYNPLITLPVLALGVNSGYKLALALSYLAAAFGIWKLGKVLGLSAPVRVWAALMYAFAGQPTARFFQGEYLFVFGFAWIPWIVAGLFQVAQTIRPRHIAGAIAPAIARAALALALMFFCGNGYYQFLILFVVGLFMLTVLVQVNRRVAPADQPVPTGQRPRIVLNGRLLLALGVTGALALGLVAIQLLPMAEYWDHTNQSPEVYGSHTPWQIFLDYTSKNTFRPDAFSVLPAREEYYAYIGLTPFIALALLPLAIRKRNRQPLFFFSLVLLFTVLWIDLDQMPWRELFLRTRFLTQFRHLLRPLIFGSFALTMLAAFGLDSTLRTLWEWFTQFAANRANRMSGRFIMDSEKPKARIYPKAILVSTVLALIGVFMLAGVSDLFNTHQPYLTTLPKRTTPYELVKWLRQYDPSDYTARGEPTTFWHDAFFSSHLRMLDAWYPLPDLYLFAYVPGQRRIVAQPKYLLQLSDAPLPDFPDMKLIYQIDQDSIYYLPHSLPLAFAINIQALYQGEETDVLRAEDVEAVTWKFSGPNSLSVQASGQAGDMLVLLYAHYPGWQVSVDGRTQPVANAQGFLGVQMQPGMHRYVFTYHSSSFSMGLAISLLSLGIAGFFIFKNPALKWL